MTPLEFSALGTRVVWLVFALGILFGATAQRTHFCTMGALTDIVYMGNWNRMRQWLLAMAVAIIGTTLLAASGSIDPAKSLYTTARLNWLSHLVGGACFGFGMVLASGCGNKTLVRIGAGNLKSLIVFIAVGLSAFMTLKGILAVPRTVLLDSQFLTLATRQDLPSIAAGIGASLPLLQLSIGGAVALALMVFVFAGREFRAREAIVVNVWAGLAVGAIIVAAWFVSGSIGHVAEDPNTLQEAFVTTNSGRMESFSFVAPFAYTLDLLMMWTDVSKAVSFGIAASLGVVAGSFLVAIATGAFKWEGFGNVEDVGNHLGGAVLMGFGGITALGCTIGQGLAGISMLSLGSILTLGGIISGAVVATRYQLWRIDATG
ncbi:MAG: YeeE/YedE family protein [Herminiimonas sp.]|nr:YeeE/YedE family protein [Herminiimonas sp.]